MFNNFAISVNNIIPKRRIYKRVLKKPRGFFNFVSLESQIVKFFFLLAYPPPRPYYYEIHRTLVSVII